MSFSPSLLLAALLPATAFAQVPPQPAESARERSEEARVSPEEADAAARAGEHQRSWEAPALSTTVTAPRLLAEEELIGSYAQPRWTARRRFPTTRIYVIPEGQAQFEYWLETKTPFDAAGDTRFRSLLEFEFGLGHHLQLDLYLRTEQKGASDWTLESERLELRWALADWGKLWGNPTLYFEYIHAQTAPHHGAEVKLLLGGEIAPRLHWGANLSYERQLGGEQEVEYAITGAVSYTLVDSKLSLGAEARLEAVDVAGSRFDFASVEPLIGPSLQWRPIPAAHVDLVALLGFETERDVAAGTSSTSGIFQPTVVFGWEF